MIENYTSDVQGKYALSGKGKSKKAENPAAFLKAKCFLGIMFLVGILLTGLDASGQTTTTYSYTGANQNFVVPAGVTSINVKIWGAGGAGSTGGPSAGGSGAFVKGTLAVTPGQTLVLVVGGTGSSSAVAGGFGGGGNAGKAGGYGGSGGGYSGIFVTSVSQANAKAIAGGGGGGGYYSALTGGGGGGATSGSDGGNRNASNVGGKGGTLSAGGAGGTSSTQTPIAGGAGAALAGGVGALSSNSNYGGGGGGGGYFGGGGGYSTNGTTSYASGGGGGSSFLGGLTATTNTAGTINTTDVINQAPGSAETGYVAGVGNGGNDTTAGGNGLIILTYTLPVSAPTITSYTPNTNLCSAGGQTVTITGTNFVQVTSVKFNGVDAASYVVVNATTITAVTPASISAGVVSVSNTGGTGSGASYTVVTSPTVTVSPTTASYCTPGASPIALTANGASTYSWSGTGNPGLSATTGSSVTSTPTTNTTITVIGTDGNGCTNAASSIISLVPAVTATISATPNVVCTGSNSQLLVTPSQAYNGTPAGYSLVTSSTTYAAITGTTLGANAIGDDVGIGNLPIGFNFIYNGVTQTVFGARSNGLIELGQTSASLSGFSANSLAGNANCIAPFWDDNNTTGGSIIYATTGSVGSRVLTVQWTGLKLGGSGTGTSTINMQLKLYEGTNQIQFIYGSSAAGSGAITASIGLSGAVGNYLSVTPLLPANTSTTSTSTENTGIAATTNVPSGTVYTFIPQLAPAYTYAWSANPTLSATNIANPMANGIANNTTYSVTVTSNGCSVVKTVDVTTTNVGPSITAQPAVSQSKCIGGTATFSVTAVGSNMSYQWRKGTSNLTNGGTISGATTATLTITGLVAGDAANDYNVVVSSPCGSPATSDNAALVIVTPLAGISASATTICQGGSVTLTENGGSATSWSWSPGGDTTNAITVSPSVTTNYIVTATTQLAGCTATANVTINVNATPSAVTVTPSAPGLSNNTVCEGTIVTLTSSGGTVSSLSTILSENFSTNAPNWTITNGGSSPAVSNWAYQTAPYTDGSGSATFSNFSTVNGGKFAYANPDAGGSGTTTNTILTSPAFSTMGYTSANLSFEQAYQYWSSGDTTVKVEISTDGGTNWSQLTSYLGTNQGVITNGAQTTVPVTISLASYLNQANLKIRYNYVSTWGYYWILDNIVINGNVPATLTKNWTASSGTLYTNAAATPGNEYVPNTPATVVYARPSGNTTYTYTVTNGSCPSQGSVTLNTNPLPVITLANSVTACKGTGVTITIPENNNNYSWSPSTGITVLNAQSVLANPLATTTYTVTTTSTSNFCQSTNQITVNVNDPGAVTTQPADRIVAATLSTTFTVAGTVGITYGYQWQIKTGPGSYANLTNDANYSGVTAATLTVSNAGSGTALDNTSYRCLLTPPAPCSAIASNDAILTISNTGIATSPADVNICLPTPSTAQFTVVTNGDEPYLVEWQVSTDNGVNYNTIELIDVNDTFLYMGPNTTAVPGLTFEHPADPGNPNGTESEFKVLNVSGITNPASLKFKAIVNEVLPSAVANLNVSNPVSFSTNLSTAEVVRCVNPLPSSATNLSVTATGSITSVEWRYDTTPGGSFTNVVANNTPAGATYVASSAGNTYSLDVTTTAATPAGSYYYKAFVLGAAGCGTTPTQSNMATITVANPAVAIAASAAAYCSPGSAVTLTASGAATYSWTSTPSGFTSSSAAVSVTPTVATQYAVVGTDTNGCINNATVNVGVGTAFTVAASATPNSVCPNAAVILNAVPTTSGATTYLIDTVPYQFTSVAGTFTALTGTTVSSGLANTDDDVMSANITPGSGFSFNYGGTNYSTFRVSSNGQLVFGNAGTQSATNDLSSSTSTQRPGLAPLWDDLLLSAGVKYQMNGTAPNRVLTVEWLNMAWDYTATAAVISFQVKLYETTNVIEYVYRRDSAAYNSGGSTGGASIGLMGTAATNFLSLQDTTANPALSTSTAKNDITTKPTNGRTYRFTPVAPITYTYAWTSTPSGFTATGTTPTANPAVNTTYNVTATSNQGCQATNTAAVTVNSAPPVVTALPAAQNLCVGATATLTVSATSATPLTYQWKKDGSPLTNNASISGATSATLTITGITAANNGSYTVDVTNCTTVTSTATVLTVNPMPTATISGNATVCQNDAQPLITFTGAAGTAPYTFTYKLNGGSNQTIATTSGNSVTLAAPTNAAGTFAYTLVSVQDSSVSACSQAQSGSATVKVNALPAAPTLTAPAVCAGSTLNLTSSAIPALSGVANYGFASTSGTYTPITGGTALATSTWDDTGAGTAIAIGFPFVFNGVSYTTCNINLNGYVSFGTTTSTTNYSPINTLTTNEVGIIAGFGRDLQGTATGEIRYQSTATEFIVQWSNARRYNSTTTNAESFNFQIHLVKTTNQAYIVYGNFSNAISATATTLPQVGLRGTAITDFKNVEVLSTGNWASPTAGGTNAATAYYNEATAAVKPASGLTYTFTPPAAGVYAWTGPNSFTSAVQNPSIANATAAASGTYTLEITNGNGCKATNTVNATVNPVHTIALASGSATQTVCINNAIANITYNLGGGATGATVSGLPAGVSGAVNAGVYTISGTPTASGTFNFTVTTTGNSCTVATATGTITVNPNNTIALTSGAGTNAQTVFVGSPITAITYGTTGATGASFSGLPAGVNGSWSGNVVTISGAPTNVGTANYTVTLTGGCGTITVNGSITAAALLNWYLDADGDHYYTGTAVVTGPSPGPGYTTTGLLGGGDCDDSNAAINPGATEICYNNIDDNCNGTKSEACAPVVVNMTPSYNNTTLPSLSTAIPAVTYTYAPYTNLKYRFKITNITTNTVAPEIIQTSRYVTIPASIHSYNAQYTITASAVINDEVVPYAGNTITVNSPTVQLITLNSATCGATLAALTSTLTANQGLNATGYTFRIRVNDANPSPTYAYSQSATRFVSANSFTGFPLAYGASYKVAVQFTFNDPVTNLPVDSGYGAECTVNTPSIPVTTMASPTCGSQVTAMNANISAAAASYATSYQFRLRLWADNGANPTYNTSVANASRFSSLTAFNGQGPITLAYNTEYAISVRYSVQNGASTEWSAWGPDCKVKTPFFPVTSLVPSQCGLTTATSLTQQLNITPYPGFPNYKVKLDEVSGEDIVNSQEIIVTYSYFRLNQFSIAQLGKNYNVSVAIKQNGVFGPYDTACDLFTPAPAKTAAVVPFKATAYPNPFANNFMLDVKSSSDSNVNIKVYDMIGRLIEQKDVRVSDMETTTIGSNYPSGVYNVVVSQEDSVQTVRVVKR